jgi:hypothetical protein
MSSSSLIASTSSSNSTAAKANFGQSKKGNADATIIKDLAQNDKVDVAINDVYKSLTVLGQEVVSKLEEILGDKLPEGGIAGLDPAEHTAEKTASRIADGSTALFAVYAKQNPNMEGEELLDSFMETIRGGISEGHQEAMSILEGIGALEFDSVGAGIEETMKLVEEKLVAFETNYRKNVLGIGGDGENDKEPKDEVSNNDIPQKVEVAA